MAYELPSIASSRPSNCFNIIIRLQVSASHETEKASWVTFRLASAMMMKDNQNTSISFWYKSYFLAKLTTDLTDYFRDELQF